MDPYPKPLRDLIFQLKRLPGVGEKTATRLALFILADREDFAGELAGAHRGPGCHSALLRVL